MRGRGRDAVAVLALVVASMLAVGVARAAWHDYRHRRDTAAFQRYVDRYIGGWRSSDKPGVPQRDRRWAIAHPEIVLREGDQACVWLALRRTPPEGAAYGSYGVSGRLSSYLHDPSVTAVADVDLRSRSTIAAGAWEYLCHGMRNEKTVPYPGEDD